MFGQLSAGENSRKAGLPFFDVYEKSQSPLQLREREQISLIDGYKMLRMELEAQQARALEWKGVHS